MASKPSPAVAHARASHAGLRRHRSPDDPAVIDAARNLKALVAEEYARELVSTWPPLTDVQRSTIAAMLAPVSTQEAA